MSRASLRSPRSSLRPLVPLLTNARYEVMPTSGVEQAVLACVPREVTVTVTASPTKGLAATLELTERLRAHGYHVVPHLSARLVRDQGHLADIVARLVAAGVDDVFVPAGDADPPAGQFSSALDVLERLTETGNPFARVGITGYPQSHPKIEDDVTVQAMWDKRRHATYIVSNLCFDPAVLRDWIRRIRRRGVTLPLLIGLAGPTDRTKLMRMAAKVGVADSARFLAGHSSALWRMAAPGAYRPEWLLGKLSATLAAPESAVEGLHVFTFNQVEQAEEWRQRLLTHLAGPGGPARVSAPAPASAPHLASAPAPASAPHLAYAPARRSDPAPASAPHLACAPARRSDPAPASAPDLACAPARRSDPAPSALR